MSNINFEVFNGFVAGTVSANGANQEHFNASSIQSVPVQDGPPLNSQAMVFDAVANEWIYTSITGADASAYAANNPTGWRPLAPTGPTGVNEALDILRGDVGSNVAYVDPFGDFTGIQSAIDFMAANGGGTIKVNPGIYTEDILIPGSVPLTLCGSVGVPFTHTGTNSAFAPVTVRGSCTITGPGAIEVRVCDISFDYTNRSPAPGIVDVMNIDPVVTGGDLFLDSINLEADRDGSNFLVGLNIEGTIDNMVLSNSRVSGSPGISWFGAGVTGGEYLITNCRVYDGVTINNASTPTVNVEFSRIDGNPTLMTTTFCEAAAGQMFITNCVLRDFFAAGGIVRASNVGTMNISKCYIENNATTTTWGEASGGGATLNYSEMTFENQFATNMRVDGVAVQAGGTAVRGNTVTNLQGTVNPVIRVSTGGTTTLRMFQSGSTVLVDASAGVPDIELPNIVTTGVPDGVHFRFLRTDDGTSGNPVTISTDGVQLISGTRLNTATGPSASALAISPFGPAASFSWSPTGAQNTGFDVMYDQTGNIYRLTTPLFTPF
jgi:hypothetical protein